jgi:hypothetical protein
VPTFSERGDTAMQFALFPTPVKAGALEITSADGGRLNLRARDGRRFVFDVAAGRYMSR